MIDFENLSKTIILKTNKKKTKKKKHYDYMVKNE